MHYPIRKLAGVACLGSAALLLQSTASGQVLFSDDFQSNSSSSWAIYGISANGVTNDYSAQFAFDYSTQTYSFNGATLTVPPAPNSGGTSKGLKVTVNKNGNAQTAAVSLYPIGKSFSGDYALKFDLWMDYNGDIPFGGSGSTEFATFGLNHLGTEVNWPNGPQNGDGDWFAVDGDGGATRDYIAFEGDPTPGPNVELIGSGGFLDRDGDGTFEQGAPDGGFAPFQLMFTAPSPFQTPGAIGKHWVQCEVRQQGGMLTWLINGYIIAQHSSYNGYSSGNIMIGYMDPYFAEIASPPNENYAIFDNVRVIDLTTSNALPVLDISATDPNATESGGDTGTVTITRTGDTTNPLTVNLLTAGTASNGVDYVTIPTSVVIPAGAASKDIVVTPINDSIGEPTETVMVALAGNPGVYDVHNNFATVNIADDGDLPIATVAALRPAAYENHRVASFSVNFANPNSVDSLVNYTMSGTATNGLDYVTVTNKALILAGTTNALVIIDPIDNNKLDGTRTVILTLASGSGYAVGSVSNATILLNDDDLPTGVTLFSDSFESSSSSSSWFINRTFATDPVTFGYNYSVDGIPPAPHTTNGTTFGLKMEANVVAGAVAAVNVLPVGGNFTGDYRVRFDMWINYNGGPNGPLNVGGDQSTEWLNAGLGVKGTVLDWQSGSASMDGIWVVANGDGGSSASYRIYKGATQQTVSANPGTYAAGSQNPANAYYAAFGNDPAPVAQQMAYPGIQDTGNTAVGNPGMAWHDVVLTKQGSTVTWRMDGILIATVDTTGTTLSTNVFVGYNDPSSGVSPVPAVSYGLVDNFKVETLGLPRPNITSIKVVGGIVQIDFTGTASDTPASFQLQSVITLVSGGPSNWIPGATISSLGGGAFRATTPVNGSVRFYRVSR
jgi:Calx-beta domain